MKELQVKAQVTEKDAEVFTAIASTAAEDRQGEIVEVEGWNIKNYKDNPILLFMHDHNKPLGKATKIWVDKSMAKPRLMFKGFISTATDYGRAAKQLMEEGILQTFSVGFRPLEMEGNRITKSELYEISLVSVPANAEARLVAVKSLEKAGIATDVIEELLPEEESKDDKEDKILRLEAQVAKLQDQVDIAVKGLTYLAPQRSKRVTEQRLTMAKAIAKAADKLVVEPQAKTVITAKIIKRSSEMLIRDMKGDL